MRRIAMLAAAGLLGVALIAGAATAYFLRDQRPRIERRHGRIVSATVTSATSDSANRVELVLLRSSSGLVVELAVKRPAPDTSSVTAVSARPLVVLLGGHRTGRNAVRLIDDTRGTVVAALSYPYDGNHRAKGMAIVREVPAIRRAILDTPAAVMLALDYLAAQPYVDPEGIEAVGVSLGAPFVTIAGALDPRIGRVWVVHGSGGVYAPLEFNLRRQIGSRAASVPLAGLATVLISGPRLAPEKWVSEIAPRPLVMINARDDDRLPRASIDRLYEHAGEPKEMIWVDGGHVRSEAEAVRPLVSLVLDRMQSAPIGLEAVAHEESIPDAPIGAQPAVIRGYPRSTSAGPAPAIPQRRDP